MNSIDQRLARLEERTEASMRFDDRIEERLSKLEEHITQLYSLVNHLRGQFVLLNGILLLILTAIVTAFFAIK